MKRVLLALIFILPACSHNIYEDSSPAQRKFYKKVILPFKTNQSFYISQGAFGKDTHRIVGHEYSWDFDVPYGTQIISVEDGHVIQVWEPKLKGGCDKQFINSAHNIKVAHKDGTVAQYVHTESFVKIGDDVNMGHVIGVTANNGFHCNPQLHFSIFQDKDHIPEFKKAMTIPVLFHGLSRDGVAREGLRMKVP